MRANELPIGWPEVIPSTATKYFTVTTDDYQRSFNTHLSELEQMNVRFAVGVGLSYLGSLFSWDDLYAVQQAGHELAYHGFIHPSAALPSPPKISEDFLKKDGFKDAIRQHNIEYPNHQLAIYGYIGPNSIEMPCIGAYDLTEAETLMPYFCWGRPLRSTVAPQKGVSSFGNIFGSIQNGIWFDIRSGLSDTEAADAGYADVVNASSACGAGQYLNISFHAGSMGKPYVWGKIKDAISYLQTHGFCCITPMRAIRHSLCYTGDIGANSPAIVCGVAQQPNRTDALNQMRGGYSVKNENNTSYSKGTVNNTVPSLVNWWQAPERIVYYGDSITNSDTSAYYMESGTTYQANPPGNDGYPPRDYSVYLSDLFGKRVSRGVRVNAGSLSDSHINCGMSGGKSTQICYIATGIGDSTSSTYIDLQTYYEANQIAAFVIMSGFNDNQTVPNTINDTVPNAIYESRYSSPVDSILAGSPVSINGAVIATLQDYYDLFGASTSGRGGNVLANVLFQSMWLKAKYPKSKIIIQSYYTEGIGIKDSGIDARYKTWAQCANSDMYSAFTYLKNVLGWDNVYWVDTLSALDMTGKTREDSSTASLHPNPIGAETMADRLYGDYSRIIYGTEPTPQWIPTGYALNSSGRAVMQGLTANGTVAYSGKNSRGTLLQFRKQA